MQLDLAPGGKFDCIAHKIDQHLAYLSYICHNVGYRFPID